MNIELSDCFVLCESRKTFKILGLWYLDCLKLIQCQRRPEYIYLVTEQNDGTVPILKPPYPI